VINLALNYWHHKMISATALTLTFHKEHEMSASVLTTITPKTNQERLAEWRKKKQKNSWDSLSKSIAELEAVIENLNQSFHKKMEVPFV
jgi:uncharacterized protein YlxW (UPF0749 family)